MHTCELHQHGQQERLGARGVVHDSSLKLGVAAGHEDSQGVTQPLKHPAADGFSKAIGLQQALQHVRGAVHKADVQGAGLFGLCVCPGQYFLGVVLICTPG